MSEAPFYLIGIGWSDDPQVVEKLNTGNVVGVVDLKIRGTQALKIVDTFGSRQQQRRDELCQVILQRSRDDGRTRKNLDRIALMIVLVGFLALLTGIFALVFTRDAAAKVNIGIITGLSAALTVYFRIVVMAMQRQLDQRMDMDKFAKHFALGEEFSLEAPKD